MNKVIIPCLDIQRLLPKEDIRVADISSKIARRLRPGPEGREFLCIDPTDSSTASIALLTGETVDQSRFSTEGRDVAPIREDELPSVRALLLVYGFRQACWLSLMAMHIGMYMQLYSISKPTSWLATQVKCQRRYCIARLRICDPGKRQNILNNVDELDHITLQMVMGFIEQLREFDLFQIVQPKHKEYSFKKIVRDSRIYRIVVEAVNVKAVAQEVAMICACMDSCVAGQEVQIPGHSNPIWKMGAIGDE